jgi:hypothetical protein
MEIAKILNEEEELPVRNLRALPPGIAEKVMTWASQLKGRS